MWLKCTNGRHGSIREGRRPDDRHTSSINMCLPNATVMRENTCAHAEVAWRMNVGDNGEVEEMTEWNERWQGGFRLPLVRTIGLTTEEGGEEEGSAGFKERQTDQSYSSANHPTVHLPKYVCVRLFVQGLTIRKFQLDQRIIITVEPWYLRELVCRCAWSVFVGFLAGETPHSTSVFQPAEGATAHGPCGEEPYAGPQPETGGWVSDTRRHMHWFHISHESRFSQQVLHSVCVFMYVWLCV